MTSTMIATPDLAKGVPYSELTRIVAEAHPSLIAAMGKASEEFYRHDAIWQEEVARNQRSASLPKRSLQSPFGKALNEAAAAVVEKSKELLAAGAVTRRTIGTDDW